MNLAGMFDRTIKPYIRILTLLFSASFLAGAIAPPAIRQQMTEVSGFSKAALKVLPYGVFEIPALLIVASYGLWLGVTVVRRMRGKESTLLRFNIEHAFRRYFAVVFPLLVVAAARGTAPTLL